MTKLVVIVGFVVAFIAGMVTGLRNRQSVGPAATPTSSPATTTRPHRGGFLTAELNLTTEQQEKLRAIWQETAMRGGREMEDRRRQFRKERDDAILALIRPEDRPAYEQTLADYSDQMAAAEAEWRNSFQIAVEQTRQILTPSQRDKYDEMLKRQEADRENRGSPGPGPWRGRDRRDGDRSTSLPTTQK